ncbi:MAG: carboxynorspermidine decarboxylase [Sphaerochaeta sp.]|nr:carboxynorspermidine decarboxylase [Sphaerochaeta sp.]
MLDATIVTHTPAFVLEYEAFQRNLELIRELQQELPCTFLFALKGFGMHRVFAEIATCAQGATASSLNEARLASEFFPSVHAYAPVYQKDEFDAIAKLSSHITFNSVDQYTRYKDRLGSSLAGLRVNPKYEVVETALYDPCSPGSRLGVNPTNLEELPAGITGLHVHNLCESGAREMKGTLAAVENLYGHFFSRLKWLNLGGGHLVTQKGYDLKLFKDTVLSFNRKYPHIELIFEPGAAYVWETGVLVSEILDIVVSDGITTLMLDTSFTAHMPDCLEMPYTPKVRGASIVTDQSKANTGPRIRLGGASCLAGDWVGDYQFPSIPKIGDRLVFSDMMHYTMVKTTMFNGIAHPDIGIIRDGSYEVIKHFSYEDYTNRLS